MCIPFTCSYLFFLLLVISSQCFYGDNFIFLQKVKCAGDFKCIIHCFNKYLYHITIISIRIKNICITPESSLCSQQVNSQLHMRISSKWSGCLPHSGKIKYWGAFYRRKTLFLGGQTKRQEGNAQICLPHWLATEQGINNLEEGSKDEEGALRTIVEKCKFHVSLKSALHRQAWLLFMPLHRSHVQILGSGEGIPSATQQRIFSFLWSLRFTSRHPSPLKCPCLILVMLSQGAVSKLLL